MGDKMKVYVDLVLILNFFFDFLLLLSVSLVLRRNIPLKKIFLGSLIGSISIFILFFKISTLILFFIKIFISILMTIITFNFKNIYYTLKNLIYLYTSSIILGGFIYFLNIQFSYKQEGLIFYHNGLSINFIFLIITSPIIIYIYIRQARELRNNYSNYYEVDISINKKKYHFKAFLDTGNKLVDPYFHKPIIIVDTNKIKLDKYVLVPIYTANKNSMLKCIKVDTVNIKGVCIKKDVMVGISDIKLEGIDCLLNQKLLEE